MVNVKLRIGTALWIMIILCKTSSTEMWCVCDEETKKEINVHDIILLSQKIEGLRMKSFLRSLLLHEYV